MANKITSALLDAIEIISKSNVSKAGYDRTIKATIVKQLQDGSYRVKHQDGDFIATADSDRYQAGDYVYVLIPANDGANVRTIVGYAAIDSRTDVTNVLSEFLKLGPSVLQLVNPDENNIFQLEENKTTKELLDNENPNILLDNTALEQSFTDAHSFWISAEFKTAFAPTSIARGTFGLYITLTEKDNKNSKVYCAFDDLHMTGNPFLQTEFTKQEYIFDLPTGKKLSDYEITSIKLSAKGFPNDVSEQLWVRNIQLIGIMRANEQSGLCASIKADAGYVLKKNGEEFQSLSFEALAYYDKKRLSADKYTTYWYKEYPSEPGDSYSGVGWKQIEADEKPEGATDDWTPSTEIEGHKLILKNDDHAKAKVSKFKLVVRSGIKQFDKIFTITNPDSHYEIKIVSDGDITPTLTCLVNITEDTTTDAIAEGTDTKIAYKWYRTQGSQKIAIAAEENTPLNQIIDIDLTTINVSTEYLCEVSINDSYLGTASFELFQKKSDYQIFFNKSRAFRYNAEGFLDEDFHTEAEVSIEKVLDKEDKEVDLSNSFITWSYNSQDSLIESLEKSAADKTKAIYTVAKKYDIQKTQNNITVTIQLGDGTICSAEYTPVFVMDGDPGTSGSDIVLVVRAKNGNPYPIVKIGDSVQLIATLYNKGEVIEASDDIPITWAWKIFRIGTDLSSTIQVNDEGQVFAIDLSQNEKEEEKIPALDKTCNMVQCIATYEGKKYYAVCPVVTTNDIDSAEALIYGFRWARYGADRLNPQYDTSADSGKYGPNDGNWSINDTYFKWNDSDISTLAPKPEFPGDGHEAAIMWADDSNGKWVHIPIYLYLNTFGLGFLNDWDGNSLEIDDAGSRILAATVGAGHKNDNNTFTGVLLGDVYDASIQSSKSGIFGYGGGVRKFFLDAETGNAYFEGTVHATQLILDDDAVTEDTATKLIVKGKAEIETIVSDKIDVAEITATELIIQAKDSDGNIISTLFSATESGTTSPKVEIAGWQVSNTRIFSGDTIPGCGIVSSTTAYGSIAFYAGATSNYDSTAIQTAPFRVTHGGALYATDAYITGEIKATSGYIGTEATGWKISMDSIIADTEGQKMYLYSGQDSYEVKDNEYMRIFIQSQSNNNFPVFFITSSGRLASQGKEGVLINRTELTGGKILFMSGIESNPFTLGRFSQFSKFNENTGYYDSNIFLGIKTDETMVPNNFLMIGTYDANEVAQPYYMMNMPQTFFANSIPNIGITVTPQHCFSGSILLLGQLYHMAKYVNDDYLTTSVQAYRAATCVEDVVVEDQEGKKYYKLKIVPLNGQDYYLINGILYNTTKLKAIPR